MTDRISAIGSYGGLGSTGAYGSYDPTMMGMGMMGGYGNLGMGYMNPMMMGGYGMGATGVGGYGNYMEQYMQMMQQMQKMREQMEERQLDHATEMHKKTQLADVANLSSHDQTFFLKATQDGDVQESIREIYDAVRKGNMDYVAQKFFELKQQIYNKYSDYFQSTDGNINTDDKVKRYICILYSEIGGGYAASNGVKPDLKDDILKYGETPLNHGFNSYFLGNKGHNQLNAEEALNQMFGTGINDIGSKERAETWGKRGAAVAETGIAAAAGAGAGMTLWGLGKIFTPGIITENVPNAIKTATKFGKCCKAGALIALGADILWQMSR